MDQIEIAKQQEHPVSCYYISRIPWSTSPCSYSKSPRHMKAWKPIIAEVRFSPSFSQIGWTAIFLLKLLLPVTKLVEAGCLWYISITKWGHRCLVNQRPILHLCPPSEREGSTDCPSSASYDELRLVLDKYINSSLKDKMRQKRTKGKSTYYRVTDSTLI